jgi:hypothetical protein
VPRQITISERRHALNTTAISAVPNAHFDAGTTCPACRRRRERGDSGRLQWVYPMGYTAPE